jgi:D-alanyl-D-alanine carboxypeptidase/D-alanyl-D-alanine-endopeptidase (penicillin-binding protein 4)
MNKFSFTIISVSILAMVSPRLSAKVLGIKGEEHSSIGVYIKDIKADTIVFESEAQRNLVPASIMKSFTSASALTILGREYRFKTEVKLVGEKSKESESVWNGNIVIIPSGDPTLESEHFGQNKGFCDAIISSLKKQGIDSINGTINIVDRMSESGPIAQWEIDDVAWSYGAGIYDFNYKDNIFSINTATKNTRPYVPNLNVTTVGTSGSTDVVRGIYSNNLYIYGSALTDSKTQVSSTMPNPAEVFIYELTSKMKAQGIAISCKNNENTLSTVLLCEHRSPKLVEILKSLMERSDNMYAEGVLRAFAPHKERNEALNIELNLWKKRNFETDYITVKDGSGLARVDRVSPQFMGRMLEWMAKSDLSSDYISLFPIAGKTGTVKSFLSNTRLSGKMVLKTGSMNGVQCYAGYKLDDTGKPTHVVVIMANSFFGTRADLKSAIIKLLLNKL